MKFAYPRFAIERDIWLKVKEYGVKKEMSLDILLRLTIVKFLKEEGFLPPEIPNILPKDMVLIKRKQDPSVIKQLRKGLADEKPVVEEANPSEKTEKKSWLEQ